MNSAERKIRTALEKSAHYHRDGMAPDEAIGKAASEEQLNPEMVRRVVEAFNIQKTNSTLKVADDKTATFPLAKAEDILKSVFCNAPLAASKEAESTQPAENDELQIIPANKKEASAGPSQETNMDVQGWFRTVQSLVLETNQKLGELSVDLLGFEQKSHAALSEVVDYFSTTNNVGKFAQFEEEILSEYGEPARVTLNIIYDLARLSEDRFEGNTKRAFYFKRDSSHDSFDRLMEHSEAYADKLTERSKLAAELDANVAESNAMFLQLFGIEDNKPTGKQASSLLDFKHAERKAAFFGLPSTREAAVVGVQGALGGQFQAAHEHAIKQQHQGPQDSVDIEKDNIKRRAILQDLMTNDENLVGAEPHGIQSAYNVLLHLAPDATLNPGVTQSFLRSALAQQTVDPFTAKQIADLQKTILQNKQLRDGKPMSAGTI